MKGTRLKGKQNIISKRRKPTAAIVPIKTVHKHKESKKTLLRLIKEAHEKNKDKKSEETEGMIDEAVRWVRRKTKT